MMASHLYIISAPSGTGKSTVVRRLLEKRPQIKLSISCTTRKPRGEEIEGREYFFLSKGEFEKRIEDGFFAEWALVHGNLYGTPKKLISDSLSKGKDVVLDIDVQGGMQLEKAFKDDAITIFLVPPSWDVLEKRLVGRGTESRQAIEKRLSNAKKEMEFEQRYKYRVVNDDLEKAVDDVISIIDRES